VSFDRASLPPMDVADRATRLREGLGAAGCDALLITNLTNIRYLTGFTGSAALLLVRADDLVFVTDGRYRDQAASQIAAAGGHAEVLIGRTADEQRGHLAPQVPPGARLGLEAEAITWAQQRRYGADWFPEAELVPTEGLVEDLRRVKDAGEVALELEWQMRRLGADGPSFDTIVASGPNGAMPHHRAGERPISEGDLVVIDFGALLDGYHSDMTRTVMVGEPSATQRRMLDAVHASQAAGVAAVRAGVDVTAVDEACRSVLRHVGWEDAFLHGTGHGVGLDIHESPRVSASATGSLADGHVVTVEPGVYLAEHGGVRIEDTVVVTAEGCRTLTLAPKEPSL
jgi:Xaa-Pro aminopeptidase